MAAGDYLSLDRSRRWMDEGDAIQSSSLAPESYVCPILIFYFWIKSYVLFAIPNPIPKGVALATILLGCFDVEHNLLFAVADGVIDIMKALFPDSAIAQRMRLKRTKPLTMKNLAKVITEEISQNWRKQIFHYNWRVYWQHAKILYNNC